MEEAEEVLLLEDTVEVLNECSTDCLNTNKFFRIYNLNAFREIFEEKLFLHDLI